MGLCDSLLTIVSPSALFVSLGLSPPFSGTAGADRVVNSRSVALCTEQVSLWWLVVGTTGLLSYFFDLRALNQAQRVAVVFRSVLVEKNKLHPWDR